MKSLVFALAAVAAIGIQAATTYTATEQYVQNVVKAESNRTDIAIGALRQEVLDAKYLTPSSIKAGSNVSVTTNAAGDVTIAALQTAEIEPLLFTQYYPDGNVKSAAEFTAGIKYDYPDTARRTITVKTFGNTGTAENDNSSLVGRVVIPPFVDEDGNGYISDDGARYKVVGVSSDVAYLQNANLTVIVAPNTVMYIGDSAFFACSSLTSASLPAATIIGKSAFNACSSLTSASLPAATIIVDTAFNDCSSLTSASLPAATTIGDYAFRNCASLTSVDFGDTPRLYIPLLGSNVFNDIPKTCKIIVPDDQYDEWVAAPDWSDLVTAGYKFLRHSEWEYARKYELECKIDRSGDTMTGNLEFSSGFGMLFPGGWLVGTDTSTGDLGFARTNPAQAVVLPSVKSGTLAVMSDIKVQSVNDQTGAVTLSAADVGALPTTGGRLFNNSQTTPTLIVDAQNSGVSPLQVGNKMEDAAQFRWIFEVAEGMIRYRSVGTDFKNFAFPSKSGTIALTSDVPDVSGYAEKAPNPTDGHLAALDAQGNPTDSGKRASDFLSASTLDGRTYDFSNNADVQKAVKDIVESLGGSVTNFPAIP